MGKPLLWRLYERTSTPPRRARSRKQSAVETIRSRAVCKQTDRGVKFESANIQPTTWQHGAADGVSSAVAVIAISLRQHKGKAVPRRFTWTVRIALQLATVVELLACSPPTKAIRIQSPAGSLRIFACGNRAGRCRRSVGFLGDLPFPPPSLLASHLREPGSIPGGVVPGFSHVRIIPDDVSGIYSIQISSLTERGGSFDNPDENGHTKADGFLKGPVEQDADGDRDRERGMTSPAEECALRIKVNYKSLPWVMHAAEMKGRGKAADQWYRRALFTRFAKIQERGNSNPIPFGGRRQGGRKVYCHVARPPCEIIRRGNDLERCQQYENSSLLICGRQLMSHSIPQDSLYNEASGACARGNEVADDSPSHQYWGGTREKAASHEQPLSPNTNKQERKRVEYRGFGWLLRGLCSCASKVKKRGSDTGDTNSHA
ncbi:hypothetical protein PR048_031581 [Dryococelus australis]|uniref:Uncharacterized protein n=1 Tax=Dryococelus australis TaxID=614101 RepID=A0ABQ9G8N1_9NEOP|nr:hypothetical protein PR048_031581 [Dryococelus australis]